MGIGWLAFQKPEILLLAALLVGTLSGTVQAETDLIARGEEVYAGKKCSACHMIKGKGGKAGGDLNQVGSKRDAKWLSEFMKAPKALLPKAKMIPFKGNDEELEALVAYLVSLK